MEVRAEKGHESNRGMSPGEDWGVNTSAQLTLSER